MSRSSRSPGTVLCVGSEAVSLYHRCAFLREQGWRVFSSTSGHMGVFRFAAELADVVVLDLPGDGSEAALIAGEMKRISPKVRVIILITQGETLVEGALDLADAAVPRSDDFEDLLKALDASRGSD